MAVDVNTIAKKLGLRPSEVKAMASYMMGHVGGKTPILGTRMAEKLLPALRGYVSQETLAHAGELGSRAAASLTSQMTDSALNSIGSTIGRAIEEGRRPWDIPGRLEQVTQLNSQQAASLDKYDAYLRAKGLPENEIRKRTDREFQKQLTKRRRTIAHTEGREITSEAREREGHLQGAQWKQWQTVGDDLVGDDHRENEEAGIIPIDQTFPSGDMHPPGRPNCRCTVSYFTDSAKAVMDKKAANKGSV